MAGPPITPLSSHAPGQAQGDVKMKSFREFIQMLMNYHSSLSHEMLRGTISPDEAVIQKLVNLFCSMEKTFNSSLKS